MTTLPFRLPDDWQAGDSGRASVWYPFVGLVIGALTWLSWKAAMLAFPPWVAGIITLIVWVTLTGGLHLDGLADCCDGLFASTSVERRLEIMKDPHIGAFGVIGLILPAGLLPLARPSGMAADFASGFRRSFILWGALIPLAAAIILGMQGILATVTGAVAAGFVLWLAKSRIGGVTGDVFGMVVEVVESVSLLVFVI
jgi:adenosylcobinamide-GDP ribazoletransferase